MIWIIYPEGYLVDEDALLATCEIAKKYNKTAIIGTSHADGSYRNCGVSISISYCIDASGEIVFISKADKRTRIIDLLTKKVETID
ncbi:hypothetical protein [Clostridium tagluense]|uniref:CN hydrolase domain-containing protein n=1 Tax=Clostridium tagluense TaxID=360422 RepID=A0A401UNH4_9CLOT|nr:hypothetical protein [Clostridium tagluense]GCD11051.1 hypothetical protein Ctaglu_26740 [Clostridium tagluense]